MTDLTSIVKANRPVLSLTTVNDSVFGDISAGAPVVLNSSGEATIYTPSGPEAASVPSTFKSSQTAQISAAFDSSTNKLVVVYRDQADPAYIGKAVVGTVIGDTVAFGTPVAFSIGAVSSTSVCFDSNSNKIVVVYADASNADYGTAVVGTVSGDSITFGTPVVMVSAGISTIVNTFDTTSNQVVVGYRRYDLSPGIVQLGAVSGTTITFGSQVQPGPRFSSGVSVAYDSNADRVVFVCADGGNLNYATAVVGTVSGTSMTFGTPVVFFSGGVQYPAAVFDSSSNKIVAAYYQSSSYRYGWAHVGTVSDTTITFGQRTPFVGYDRPFYMQGVFDPTLGVVTFAYGSSMDTYDGYAVTGRVNGDVIEFFSSPGLFSSGLLNSVLGLVYDPNAQRAVVVYADQYEMEYGKTAVIHTVAPKTDQILGLAEASAAPNTPVEVTIAGGVNGQVSSLTPGLAYYYNPLGSLVTEDIGAKAGIALSASSILLT